MSEFKFSCPNCQQNIAATSEYSGAQISCPSCQTPIIVPAAPDAPAPPHGSKLTMAPSTTNHPATATQFISQGGPIRRKKKHTGLYVGLACGTAAILGVIIFWQPLNDLGHSALAKLHHETAPVVEVPTNEPPPPPPELTTEEIIQNVADTYKSLTNYVVKGLAVGAINTQGAANRQAVQNTSEGVSLELGRTNLYRLQWTLKTAGAPFKGVAWSAGRGDFIGYDPYPPAKSKNRQSALLAASAVSQAQCIALAQLFFDETNSLGRQAAAFAKTNGPGLATKINGRDCYVLDGQFNAHDLVLWIDKETFLIPQIQFLFGGKLDESVLKDMSRDERTRVKTWARLRGSITETYDKPETNKDMVASAFETEFAPSLNLQMQQAPAARARPRGANPGSPTQLTRRVREGAQQ